MIPCWLLAVFSFRAKLANSQGGSDSNLFETLAQMGNQTITCSGSSQTGLSELSESVKNLTASLTSMKQDIEALKGTPNSCQSSANEMAESDADNEVENFLVNDQVVECEGQEEWMEISTFFEEELETGECIVPELAKLVNASLRQKVKKEKLQELEKKHKRPSNVENLQVLKVEEMLWRQ